MNIRITIIMTVTSPPLLWHQVSFSVELPPLSFVRRTSWAIVNCHCHCHCNCQCLWYPGNSDHDDMMKKMRKMRRILLIKDLMLSLLSTVRPPVLSWKWSTAIVVVQGLDHLIDKCDDNDDGEKNKNDLTSVEVVNIINYFFWRWWLHRTAGPRQGSSSPRPGPPRSEQEID